MKEIIIVAGLGRCGSTMIMQMLRAGGMPVVADNLVSCEDSRSNSITKKSSWLEEAQGKAIKVLLPDVINLPNEFSYRIIWIKRDYNEQAKSQVKFLRLLQAIHISSSAWKKMARELPKQEMIGMIKFKRRSLPIAIFTFEDILIDPLREAIRICEYLKQDHGYLLPTVMANVVKKRSSKCAEGLDIEIEYMNKENTTENETR